MRVQPKPLNAADVTDDEINGIVTTWLEVEGRLLGHVAGRLLHMGYVWDPDADADVDQVLLVRQRVIDAAQERLAPHLTTEALRVRFAAMQQARAAERDAERAADRGAGEVAA